MTDQDQFEKAYAYALGGHIAPAHIRMQRAPRGAKEAYLDPFINAAYTGWKLGRTAPAGFTPSKDGARQVQSSHEVDPDDFPLGKACDLSGEGNCEACQ